MRVATILIPFQARGYNYLLISSLYILLSLVSYWRRQWHPTPVLLPGKSHGQRSLVGCSPWGHEESDPTERLHFHFSLSCIGEGNGNPLQCSCLENPRDRAAWWAAVYGVAQSQTWLKRLSRSSSSFLLLEIMLSWSFIVVCFLNFQEWANWDKGQEHFHSLFYGVVISILVLLSKRLSHVSSKVDMHVPISYNFTNVWNF